MVLMLDGVSEIGAHVWSDLKNLICLRQRELIRTFFLENIFSFSSRRAQHDMIYHLIAVPCKI